MNAPEVETFALPHGLAALFILRPKYTPPPAPPAHPDALPEPPPWCTPEEDAAYRLSLFSDEVLAAMGLNPADHRRSTP